MNAPTDARIEACQLAVATATAEAGRLRQKAAETQKALDSLEDNNARLREECERYREAFAERGEEIERLMRENAKLAIVKRWADRLPFCPDHRDKVAGKPCRECEIERLAKSLRKANDGFEEHERLAYLRLNEIERLDRDIDTCIEHNAKVERYCDRAFARAASRAATVRRLMRYARRLERYVGTEYCNGAQVINKAWEESR